jgi:hypothetical protein
MLATLGFSGESHSAQADDSKPFLVPKPNKIRGLETKKQNNLRIRLDNMVYNSIDHFSGKYKMNIICNCPISDQLVSAISVHDETSPSLVGPSVYMISGFKQHEASYRGAAIINDKGFMISFAILDHNFGYSDDKTSKEFIFYRNNENYSKTLIDWAKSFTEDNPLDVKGIKLP